MTSQIKGSVGDCVAICTIRYCIASVITAHISTSLLEEMGWHCDIVPVQRSGGQVVRHAGASVLREQVKGEKQKAAREPQSRKLRVVSSSLPIPLTLCVPDFLPGLSNPPVISTGRPPHSHSRPHTNGLNKRSAWLGCGYRWNPEEW